MKSHIIRLLIIILILSLPIRASTLTTKNYIVTITINCEEGNVRCDDVSYFGFSKKSGKSIALVGKTMHTTCADGMTPCRFLGYEFNNGNITYIVFESGLLQVIKNENEILLEEKGKWKD